MPTLLVLAPISTKPQLADYIPNAHISVSCLNQRLVHLTAGISPKSLHVSLRVAVIT